MVIGTTFSVIIAGLIVSSLLLSVGFQFRQYHVLAQNSTNATTSSIDRFNIKLTSNDGKILHRGIITSEHGQPENLDVQRTVILPHRNDGKDYSGILSFTASKPVEVLLGHRMPIDEETFSKIDNKRFGSLFLVHPVHPNVSEVFSAPTVIKPAYGLSSPFYSASVPFVGSSVVLRTLHGEPFVAVYEVSAQLGQPEIVIDIETAKNNTGTE